MSLSLYDEAFLAKLKKWTEKTNIRVYDTNDYKRLFETTADDRGDLPMELPIVSLSREPGYKINNANLVPMAYDGKMIEATEARSISMNAIPITITYRLDVLTRYFNEADEYMRNILFNLIRYPKLNVKLKYNGEDIIHQSSIHIATDVLDTSSDLNRVASNQFVKLSIGIIIDDAYIWDFRLSNNVSIDIDNTLMELS